MRRLIEELWNGNISPAENCGVGDPEIENLVMLMERHGDTLKRELAQPQREVFEKFVDCAEEYTYRISVSAFGDGFRLGGRLLCEALSDNV